MTHIFEAFVSVAAASLLFAEQFAKIIFHDKNV